MVARMQHSIQSRPSGTTNSELRVTSYDLRVTSSLNADGMRNQACVRQYMAAFRCSVILSGAKGLE